MNFETTLQFVRAAPFSVRARLTPAEFNIEVLTKVVFYNSPSGLRLEKKSTGRSHTLKEGALRSPALILRVCIVRMREIGLLNNLSFDGWRGY